MKHWAKFLLCFFLNNTNCHSTNFPPLSLLPWKLLKFLEFPKRTGITFPATGAEIRINELFETQKKKRHQTTLFLTFSNPKKQFNNKPALQAYIENIAHVQRRLLLGTFHKAYICVYTFF